MIGASMTRNQQDQLDAAYRRLKAARAEEVEAREQHKEAKDLLRGAEDAVFQLLQDLFEPSLFNRETVDQATGEVTR